MALWSKTLKLGAWLVIYSLMLDFWYRPWTAYISRFGGVIGLVLYSILFKEQLEN